MAHDNLLRTIPESRKHFESLRGKHRRKGKLWYPNLINHLEDPKEGSSRWWDKAEFLTLASLYCERRARGHELFLEGASELAHHLGSTTKLSHASKFRLYRILACPLAMSHTRQWSFQQLWSRENLERRHRAPDFPYSPRNLLMFASSILPTVKATGASIAVTLHDFMVTSWLENHKELWKIDPDTYVHNTSPISWDNDHRTGFIRGLIVIYNKHDRDKELAPPDWMGPLSREQFLERSLEVIQDLADYLQVSIEDIEIDRVFSDFLKGRTSAEELPGRVSVWKGVQNQEFAASVNALLNNPQLLKLVSPEHALTALLKRDRKTLLLDLLVSLVTEADEKAFRGALMALGLNIDNISESHSYQFTHWHNLLCGHKRRFYDSSDNVEATRKLMGVKALLLELMDPEKKHGVVADKLKALMAQAEHDLDKLLEENAQHIKTAKKLFDKIASLDARERRSGEYTISLERMELPPDRRRDLRVPVMASAMIQDMQDRLTETISEKISELIDDDWRVLTATGVSFDD